MIKKWNWTRSFLLSQIFFGLAIVLNINMALSSNNSASALSWFAAGASAAWFMANFLLNRFRKRVDNLIDINDQAIELLRENERRAAEIVGHLTSGGGERDMPRPPTRH